MLEIKERVKSEHEKRTVKIQYFWEMNQDWESHSAEVEVRLSEDLIARIAKNKRDSLEYMITADEDFLTLYEAAKEYFDNTYSSEDEAYQAYVDGGNYIDCESYSEWLFDRDLNFVISIADMATKYGKQDFFYPVDCYASDRLLKTVFLPVRTRTEEIFALIDSCLAGIPVNENEKLADLASRIRMGTENKIRFKYPEISQIMDKMVVGIPKDIYDCALEFGEPKMERPKPVQNEEIIIPKKSEESDEKKEVKPVEKKPAPKPVEPKQTAKPVEPKQTPKPVESKQYTKSVEKPVEKKVEAKTELFDEKKMRKISSHIGVIAVILAVVALIGIYIYKVYFVVRDADAFARDQVAYVVVDGYYDVYDYTLEEPEDFRMVVNNLDLLHYVRVLNPFEKPEDNTQRIGGRFYDENGKLLREIIYYSDERIVVDGILCKPALKNGNTPGIQHELRSQGRQIMEKTLDVKVEEMMQNAKREEDGGVTIELIDIPFEDGYYSKIWVNRIDAETGKEKRVVYIDKKQWDYEYIPGYKTTLPLKQSSEKGKLKSLWLNIDVCGITLTFELTDLIPEELRAEQ